MRSTGRCAESSAALLPYDASALPPAIMINQFAPSSKSSNRLQRLVTLRWVAVIAELGLVVLTRQWLGSATAIEPVLAICTAQLGLNLASIAYRHHGESASDGQLFAQILFDIGALTLIAYLSGGSTNPLISLYLLWVAAGAAMLEARLATILTAVSIACYSLVNFVHTEVHVHDPAKALEIHLIGMWLIFVFSAIAICWSVIRMTSAVRRRDAQLADAREAALRNERVVALGNLAAGAAHELGTPLATMAVLAGELLHDPRIGASQRSDIELMQAQINDCKRIITELAAQAGTSRPESLRTMTLDAWIDELLQRWQRQRPLITPRVHLVGARPGPRLAVEATLGQAFLNLFNNAADASPDKVEIEVSWDEGELRLCVLDRGGGITGEIQARLGRDVVSTRGEGRGMGLVLAYAAIERIGGQVSLSPREGGGTVAQVHLPLEALLATANTAPA